MFTLTLPFSSATLCENTGCNSDLRSLYVAEGGCGVGESLRRAASDRVAGTCSGGPASDGAPSDTTDDDWSRESPDEPNDSSIHLNDLDIKVIILSDFVYIFFFS